MEKKVKILIVAMAIVIAGLVTFIVTDKVLLKKDRGNDKNKNDVAVENNIEENINEEKTLTLENEKEVDIKNTSNIKDDTNSKFTAIKEDYYDIANKAIREELKSRRFIAKNNLELREDVEPRFMKITSSGEPMYLVHIDHTGNGSSVHNVFFFVRYKDGQVVFDKDFEHKYEFDIFVDLNKKAIRAQLDYKMTERTYYHTFDLDGIVQNKLFWKTDYNVENTKYIIYTSDSNGNEVERECTEDEFKAEMNELESEYQFVKFDDVAVTLTDENIDKVVK